MGREIIRLPEAVFVTACSGSLFWASKSVSQPVGEATVCTFGVVRDFSISWLMA